MPDGASISPLGLFLGALTPVAVAPVCSWFVRSPASESAGTNWQLPHD